MPINNRSMDASQQKEVVQLVAQGVVATGATLLSAPIPFPGVLSAAFVAAQGASGAPTSSLEISRFIAGAGATVISGLAASFIIPVRGLSGTLGLSMVAAGSTLLNVMAGDCIQIRLGTANTAAVCPVVSVVVQKTQDIVTYTAG